MKKQLSFILALLISITSVMFAFSWLFQPKQETNAQEVFNENNLKDKVDIVDPNNMNAAFLTDMVENQNPFNLSTKEMMTGYSVVPKTTNNLKDIDSAYVIDEFSVVPEESIFMWIFIPNDYYFDLTIAFEDASSNRISWTFSRADLLSMLEDSKLDRYAYGWRLFEFCLSDADMTETVEDNISFYKFKTMKVSYINNTGTFVEKNKNKFSFYHVFRARSFSNYSCIVDTQTYVQYKLNSNFVGDRAYYIDDEILFTNIKSIFDVLIIGQTNLRDYSNSNYSFEISVQDPKGDVISKYFGEKFIFDTIGYHRVSFTIKEFRSEKSEIVLFEQLDFYVDYFAIGSFTNVNYIFEEGEKTAISFKFSKSFIMNETDIEVQSSDKTIAEVTHYIKDGVCYIHVTGLKEGEFDLIVKAKGERLGTNDIKVYSVKTAANVIDSDKKSSSEIFLWVVLAIYGGGIAIFVVISLVKARQVSVK